VKPLPWILMAAWLVMSLGGCGTSRQIVAPTAQMTGMHLAQQTEHGLRLEIELLLENPNDVALPVPAAYYQVTIAEVGTFSFQDEPHRTIAARGRQTVRLPAAMPIRDQDVSGKRCEVRGRVVYDPPGEFRRVLTEARFPLPAVSFTGHGQLP
jgi:hypothetical protein